MTRNVNSPFRGPKDSCRRFQVANSDCILTCHHRRQWHAQKERFQKHHDPTYCALAISSMISIVYGSPEAGLPNN
jgi:hypothetical protein